MYELPLGAFGELAHGLVVRRDLERIFEYRRLAIVSLLDRSQGQRPDTAQRAAER
ncbi:MAG: hypothetical protein ACRDL3_00450 [Solirubrobacterales bacterium]